MDMLVSWLVSNLGGMHPLRTPTVYISVTLSVLDGPAKNAGSISRIRFQVMVIAFLSDVHNKEISQIRCSQCIRLDLAESKA